MLYQLDTQLTEKQLLHLKSPPIHLIDVTLKQASILVKPSHQVVEVFESEKWKC